MRVKRSVVLFTFLAIVALLALPGRGRDRVKAFVRDGTVPLHARMVRAGNLLHDAGSALLHPVRTARERERMLAEMADLRMGVARLRHMEEENAELRRLAAFRRNHPLRLAMCEVVARGDAGGWWQTLTLARGLDDGIRPNMAVMTPDGLVGKTTSVSRRSATVLLLSDPRCRVSCRLPRTGGFGVVRGGGVSAGGDPRMDAFLPVEPPRLDYVASGERLARGDEVVTSGMGGVFPAGLPVGRVMESGMDASGLYQWAQIAPAAGLGTIRHVFVVLDRS